MSNWISVKKQPIPKNCYLLACINKKQIEIVFRVSNECFVKHNSLYTVDVEDITHWQPLPEPPKESKNE